MGGLIRARRCSSLGTPRSFTGLSLRAVRTSEKTSIGPPLRRTSTAASVKDRMAKVPKDYHKACATAFTLAINEAALSDVYGILRACSRQERPKGGTSSRIIKGAAAWITPWNRWLGSSKKTWRNCRLPFAAQNWMRFTASLTLFRYLAEKLPGFRELRCPLL